MKIEKTYVTFEQSKWLKKKGFDEECTGFYVKSNSKLFGIDEHNRYYPIVNKPKQLWIVGNTVTLNEKNVLLAPEQWQICEWLRVNHGIWVWVEKGRNPENFYPVIDSGKEIASFRHLPKMWRDTPQKAYSAAFDYILTNNLI
jgi:hypothetical protein